MNYATIAAVAKVKATSETPVYPENNENPGQE